MASALAQTDWAQDWLDNRPPKALHDDVARWNKRAATFGNVEELSAYTVEFLAALNAQPGDTLLDMGCGNGCEAVPLAKTDCKVVARDFSPAMIEACKENAAAAGVAEAIDAAVMSWEDDWEAAGIAPKSVDIAFASRSVITRDLGSALRKLSAAARRFACATVSTGYTPKESPTLLRDLGVTAPPTYDFAYVFNILVQLGYTPQVTYIVHERRLHFDTLAEGVELFADILDHAEPNCGAAALAAAYEALPGWVEARMEDNEAAGTVNRHGETEGRYKIVMPDDIRWALVKWEV